MIHSYSTDSVERRYIPFFLAVAAIASAFLVSRALAIYQIELPWWGLPIDTMTFYGLFYLFFDRVIWKWRWIHQLGITKIPDLSGEWRGNVHPVRTNGVSAGLVTSAEIAITIQQTWTDLLITGHTGLSSSRNLSGNFIVSDECTLSYEYLNEPNASAPATMHAHRGMARLEVKESETVLEGEYYSGRDRQNIGAIRLVRNIANWTQPPSKGWIQS
jgi:hypothetical protein